MSYKELANIANLINQSQPDIDGLLQMFCLKRVADNKFLATFFLQIERDGRLHLRSLYGASEEDFEMFKNPISIFDDHPASLAVRTGQLSWSNKSISENKIGSLLAWPILADERILGVVLGIYEVPFSNESQDLEYFEAVGSVVGNAIIKYLTVSKKGGLNGRGLSLPLSQEIDTNSEGILTERQELILKLMAEGRTNHDIADVLGYSESLIRQETIRIYAILGCSGRAEAAKIFKIREQEKVLANNK
jgi:DNA-binding CsgD family transcriptional regulator